MVAPDPLGRPQLRGVLHQAAFSVSLVVGTLLIVYARRRPDPIPHVFGYHELFHALTLVAVACQYVAVAFWVVRVG